MDEQKETKPTEATPEQVGAFMAQLMRSLGTQADQGDGDGLDVAYANNFNFEASVWDLKIIFGQLDQQAGAAVVDWHTAITIPWLQVKLAAYFLRLQALWHEMQNGPINIPASVMPRLLPPTEEEAKNPANVTWYESCKTIYEQMFGPLPATQLVGSEK
jgi:hypothetical protein